MELSQLQKIQAAIQSGEITDQQAAQILYDWRYIGRPKQQIPGGNWRIWLIMAGRGFGKTRTGAEYVRMRVAQGKRHIALVGRTVADVRDVMVKGPSGILAVSPTWDRPKYEPSKRSLTWPNGAVAKTYSADKPDQLRGPEHDDAWCDEIAAWRYPDAWDMLLMGLRRGDNPTVCATTTPRPIPLVKGLLEDETVRVTSGSSYENRANLAGAFFDQIVKRYEGTRLGRQELYAELLDDVPGALWQRDVLEKTRVTKIPVMKRVVVALDPAVSSGEQANETGIIVAGLGEDGHGYVLDDVTLRGTPAQWARAAIATYYVHEADRMIAEVNNGGDMIEHTIRTEDNAISFKQVRATRGKVTRAEPVAALYEQRRVHHVGMFGELEDQLCSWVPGDESPDRMDALVWAFTELMLGGPQPIETAENPFYG